MVTPPLYITTSWDDGHPLDLRVAELLHKYDLRATFYIPIENELPVLTPSQVRALSAEFEIGAHTLHHSDLLTIPESLTYEEIAGCKTVLEQICSRRCTAFCFPKGHFRRNHLRHVRSAGYRVARTVELMSLDMPRMHSGLAMVATTVQAGPMGFLKVARNSLKRLRPGNLFRHMLYGNSDWVATAERVLEHVLSCGGVFHFWGHSWEVDQMGQWQNLERVLATLSQCKGRAVFTDNTGLTDLAMP
jgi:peptidoglycan-N-acetylglucosamine deacetylase